MIFGGLMCEDCVWVVRVRVYFVCYYVFEVLVKDGFVEKIGFVGFVCDVGCEVIFVFL